MAKLTADKLEKYLAELKGWNTEGDFITKTFKFREFMDGIEFINEVAKIAEKLEHHPDIHVRYTTVKLALQSHDEGGITMRDIRLAKAIEKSLKS
ncbi:MAG: 4a-hydroxytetrahydrobiopterin dehydratase [Conexivisphaerales archaeon]